MLLAEIHLSATQSLWPLIAAFAVLVGFVAWAYGRSAGSTSVRIVCTTLKIIGIAALVLCLLEPLLNKQLAKPGSNYFVVVADNSQGLQIHDRGQVQSRGQQMKKLLADGAKPLADSNRIVRSLGFSHDLRLSTAPH